ncbi:MAG: hypothetical protein QMC36_05305 [Patescibacteria group bacterium]
MEVSKTGSSAAAAYVQQSGAAQEARIIESNRQNQARETPVNERTGPLPLATSGTVGTRVNVSA